MRQGRTSQFGIVVPQRRDEVIPPLLHSVPHWSNRPVHSPREARVSGSNLKIALPSAALRRLFSRLFPPQVAANSGPRGGKATPADC